MCWGLRVGCWYCSCCYSRRPGVFLLPTRSNQLGENAEAGGYPGLGILLPQLLLRFGAPTFFAHAASRSWSISVCYSHCLLGALSVAMATLAPKRSWCLCVIYTDVAEKWTFVALRKAWTLLASTLMTILERVIRLNSVCDFWQRARDTRQRCTVEVIAGTSGEGHWILFISH
jgi:hypothetical protein